MQSSLIFQRTSRVLGVSMIGASFPVFSTSSKWAAVGAMFRERPVKGFCQWL